MLTTIFEKCGWPNQDFYSVYYSIILITKRDTTTT